MYWYVCKYEQTGNIVILPDFYMFELMMSSYYCEVEILKSFEEKEMAMDYLTGICMAENLINKVLEQ